MKPDFPRNLQRQFEQAIVSNAFTTRQIFTCGELASRVDIAANAMLTVLKAAHRKGLVVEQNGGLFKIIGVTVPPRDSVFSHTQKSGLKPTSVVREVVIEPAIVYISQTGPSSGSTFEIAPAGVWVTKCCGYLSFSLAASSSVNPRTASGVVW